MATPLSNDDRLDSPTVAQAGELGVLAQIRQFAPPDALADDGAVVAIRPGHQLVVSTDVLVDGVHFSLGLGQTRATMSPEDAGWRAAAANLSDLAAMGATPLGLTVGLGLPGDLPLEWVTRLYRGLGACLQAHAPEAGLKLGPGLPVGALLGGDICRAPVLTLAITALGEVRPEQVIYRHTAQPDWTIVVTGSHGGARAGLERLLYPDAPGSELADLEQGWMLTHRRPRPRLDVLPHLGTLRPAGIAGMDSSDGLANAVVQLCQASGVGATVLRSQIPLPPGLSDWVGPDRALDWALYGGEDFELVLCLPPQAADQLTQRLGATAAQIGKITADPTIQLRLQADNGSGSAGDSPWMALTLDQGYQHFVAPDSREPGFFSG